jgi:uncharacterized protein (DUF1501 family)
MKAFNQQFNRRRFLSTTGVAATALAVSPRFAFAGEPASDRKIRCWLLFPRASKLCS